MSVTNEVYTFIKNGFWYFTTKKADLSLLVLLLLIHCWRSQLSNTLNMNATEEEVDIFPLRQITFNSQQANSLWKHDWTQQKNLEFSAQVLFEWRVVFVRVQMKCIVIYCTYCILIWLPFYIADLKFACDKEGFTSYNII